MKAILINSVDRKVSEIQYNGNIEEIYQALNCQTFTIVRLENGDTVFVDDEGLLGNPQNFFTIADYGTPIAGNGLVLGETLDGESKDCASTVDEVSKDVIFMDIATVLIHQRLFG